MKIALDNFYKVAKVQVLAIPRTINNFRYKNRYIRIILDKKPTIKNGVVCLWAENKLKLYNWYVTLYENILFIHVEQLGYLHEGSTIFLTHQSWFDSKELHEAIWNFLGNESDVTLDQINILTCFLNR